MSELYNLIDTLCKDKGINVTTLCRESGASRGALSDLNVGRIKKLSTDTLSKIAAYFDVSVDYLLGNKNDVVVFGTELENIFKRISLKLDIPYTEMKSLFLSGLYSAESDMAMLDEQNLTTYFSSLYNTNNIKIQDKKNAPQVDELHSVYLSFAKDAQDNGLDPEDIKTALALLKSMKAKRNQQED